MRGIDRLHWRGWCFPAGVVLRNGDRCLVPGDDALSLGRVRCVAPFDLREEVVGPLTNGSWRVQNGACRTKRGRLRIFAACGTSPDSSSCCLGRAEGPRRGTKPRKDVMRLDRQRSRSSSGLGGGATPRSRRSAQVGFRGVHWQRWMLEGLARATANGKGATATVTWCGCRRGFLRGV